MAKRIYVFAGIKVKEIRTAKNLTIEQCANDIGTSYQQWQRWEMIESNPTAVNITRICDVLDCSPADLFLCLSL